MNVFQLPYETRLQSWFLLRAQLCQKNLQTKCMEIDQWWQQAPLVNHYLHPSDIIKWPGPWELVEENNYCLLARGLGIYYTLWLSGIKGIDFLIGKCDNDDVALITVDHAKYVLNSNPGMVISSNLADYKIKSKLDLTPLTDKIG
jgi:hypothetical protein